MLSVPPARSLGPFVGVGLLTAGNIFTLYGAYSLRGVFGNLTGSEWGNAVLPFVLLALPLFAVYALAELKGFRLTRLVGLPVSPGVSPLASAGLFAVFGVFWLFVKAGNSDKALVKAEAALAKPAEPQLFRAPGRESMETLVFVVVLVMLLQLFVVQAFVIPTGSMAETMYGYRKTVVCRECGYQFEVNASREAEPQGGAEKQGTVGYCCPNCRYATANDASKDVKKGVMTRFFGWADWQSGDRVLVAKFLAVGDRGRVVVFKFPDAPQTGQTPQNYIKRLVGLPGETIAISGGDLYATTALTYPAGEKGEDGKPLYPRAENPLDQWRAPYSVPDERDTTGQTSRPRWSGPDYRYTNAPVAVELFDKGRASGFPAGGFEIVRKPDDLVLEERRIVYDNDHQSSGLIKVGAEPRWAVDKSAGDGWVSAAAPPVKAFAHDGGGFGWVRYRHLLPAGGRDDRNPGWEGTPTANLTPRKVTNFQGYNGGFEDDRKRGPGEHNLENSDHWVGDLLLECTAEFAAADATVVLELSKGEYRHRAEFSGGQVRVKRFNASELVARPDGSKGTRGGNVPPGKDEFTLAEVPTGITSGTHKLRFANVDCRLRVWVDDKPLDFGGKADYPPPPPAKFEDDDKDQEGWQKVNDIDQPASVGAGGGVKVSGLTLWRDTFYVNNTGGRAGGKLDTYYVQPGHYLCMGDNSTQSSDGRMWGLVPERLMLGRAVFTFFPMDRVGFIR